MLPSPLSSTGLKLRHRFGLYAIRRVGMLYSTGVVPAFYSYRQAANASWYTG